MGPENDENPIPSVADEPSDRHSGQGAHWSQIALLVLTPFLILAFLLMADGVIRG